MERAGQVCLGHRLSRRAVLRSACATAGLWGLPAGLPAAGAANSKKRSLILLWQDGGPSHFETFDPKPDAPSEFRGELNAIPTAVPGIAFCEVLPRLAGMADRMSIIRSLHQPSSGHVIGSHNVLTGWYGQTDGGKSRYPDLASVISRMRSGVEDAEISLGASTDARLAKGMRGTGGRSDIDSNALPRYIDISRGLHRGGPAFLGPLYSAFQVAGDPAKPGFVVQNLQAAASPLRFRERYRVLNSLDRLQRSFSGTPAAAEQLRAVAGFQQQALELLAGGAAAQAFDLSREEPDIRERFGRHLAGQQCLLARRLVEAGVGVVTVRFTPDGRGDYDKTMIGWDDHAVHGNIFAIMKKRGPQFDQAVSALIEDLEQRGLRDEVLLVLVGEFGRTPRIHVHKGCPGRELWGPAGCALVYGGGLSMGQIVGSTNDKGERPRDDPHSYQDLLATIYQSMGVDHGHTFLNPVGRPVPILPDGQPIGTLTGSQPIDTRKTHTLSRTRESVPQHITPRRLQLPPGAGGTALSAQQDFSQLESIVARDSSIDDKGLAPLSRCRNLKRLHLNGAPLTDAGLAHLAGLTRLEDLNLTGTYITDAGLSQLKALRQLKRFSFNGTSVSLSGVIRLFVDQQQRTLIDALSAMGLIRFDAQGRVVAIDVASTSFGDQDMAHLQELPALTELQLTATHVTDAGMSHVRKLPRLEQLYLAKCAVSDTGLAHVAALPRLRAINLYGTQLTTAGLEHLMGLEHLELLMITDVKLDPAAVDKLKNKLPRLTVTDFTPA